MIASLMYLIASRPDIMFVVCACARFQVTPKVSHLHAEKRIFRYLKGQPKLGLWYPRDSPFDLEAFSDSDYAGASLDRKSTTGGCQFLDKRLISWQCKKQTVVANSTTKAEYVAAANCCRQVLWIQNQMLDYRFNFMNTKIYIDNESTICIVKNPVFHSKTKHIEIRHHFIRDSYEKKLIQVIKIHTDHNVADLLTKAFDVSRKAKRIIEISKSSRPIPLVIDATVIKEWEDRMERAATPASSLEAEQDSVQCSKRLNLGAARVSKGVRRSLAVTIWTLALALGVAWVKTATVRTVDNGEQEITATVDGKEFTITEASIRRHLQLVDVDGVSALPTTKCFDQLSLMGYVSTDDKLTFQKGKFSPNNMKRGFSGEHTPLFPSMLAIQAEEDEGSGHPSKPQPSPSTAQPIHEEPIPNITSEPIPNVPDEAVYEEWDDRVPRSHGGSIAQTRSERVPTPPHDSPLPRVNALGSDEGSMSLQELTVKKLEKTVKTSQARRRAKIMVSDDEDDLEDSSKQGRMIEEIDQDAGVTLVTPIHSQEDKLEDQLGVFSAAKVLADAAKNVHTYTRRRRAVSTDSGGVSTISRLFSTAEESVSTAGAFIPVSTTSMVQKVNISIPTSVVIKDKGKGIMEESEEEQSKRTKLQQEQDRLGHEAAVRLQEELDEEERQRMARVHATAQSFTEEEWENIKARVEADEELTQGLQAEERNKYSEVDQAKMLVDLINQRKRYFAAHKSEAKRNKPMTQAQQRNYMMNYIKHMGSHTVQQLKRYSFDELKELFETTIKNVNAFIPMETEYRERASKLAAGSSQATITDSVEVGSSKRAVEVGLDHEVPVEEVYVEALQVKYPIIDWEIYSKDTRRYWRIIRVGNHTEAYHIFTDILKKFYRDDLVKLWDLVKEGFSTTKPIDDKKKELWVELKRLFKPDSDDTLWKLQRYMHDPLVWRLYDTCGVHHVSSVRGHDIFMLVEKDYPLSKGVQMLTLATKLWFNSEKLVDLDNNHKFRGGLLGFKPITLSTAKGRVYTTKLSYIARVEDGTAKRKLVLPVLT
ncbi:hypothetical protein Tco_1019744 [Tanacetum coccineum]|uniref:Uncharacterized protein n=1 Tax=Tanacetum coccineum TaxID=301880 RepID=A0ABQ5FYF2_9ASTR